MNFAEVQPDRLTGQLRALYLLWAGRRRDTALPSRKDFSLDALKPWLGHLALIDTAGGFRFRLCGTELIPRYGREATGLSLDELPDETGGDLKAAIRHVCATRRPVAVAAAVMDDGRLMEYCELALPLSDDGVQVTTVLLGSYPQQRSSL